MPVGWGGGVWLRGLLVRRRRQALVPGWRRGWWSAGRGLQQRPGSERGQGSSVPPFSRGAGPRALSCLWFWHQCAAGLRDGLGSAFLCLLGQAYRAGILLVL